MAGFVAAILASCSGPFSQDGEEEKEPTSAAPTEALELPPATAAPAPPTAIQPDPQTTIGSYGRAIPGGRAVQPREVFVPFAAVVSPKLQVRELSYAELQAVWNLDINNWRELGDPLSTPVRRYTFPDVPLPLRPFGGDVPVEQYDELAESFWYDRGAIAIVPTHMVDHRVRTLQIDGVDILRSQNAPNPLQLQMYGIPEEIAPETLRPRRQSARLTFTGDIIFGRFVQVALEERNDFAASFRSISGQLQEADLTIGNLECSLSDSFEQPEREDPQTFRFKTGTVTVAGLELADIEVVTRANNHSFDFGSVGMDDTSRTLEAAGIKHFGMGHTLAEARQPAICEVGDLSFAFLGYDGVSDGYYGATENSAGTSPMVERYVREDVGRLVAAGHIVLPYFHWGVEYVAIPTPEQRRFAHVAIDAGAAAVIGSHPHWVQAIETYQGKPIIYSLGNFVFDQAWSRETTEGIIADLWFEGSKVTGVDLRPTLIVEEHRPILLDEDDAYHVLERIWTASEQVRDG